MRAFLAVCFFFYALDAIFLPLLADIVLHLGEGDFIVVGIFHDVKEEKTKVQDDVDAARERTAERGSASRRPMLSAR